MSRHDRGVRWRPCARGPARLPPAREYFFLSPLINSVQIRFPEMIWVVFLSVRRFGLKRFDSVTFCFRIRILSFKICEMILFEVFFSVQIKFPEMV